MKRETHILLCLIGFAGLGVLLYQLSTPEVWQHVLMMGWGYVPVIGLSLVVFVYHAWIWRACFDREAERPRLRAVAVGAFGWRSSRQCGAGIAGWQGGRQGDCA